ncbi:MAG: hypothetical protein WBG48_18765 [Pricia sp.]
MAGNDQGAGRAAALPQVDGCDQAGELHGGVVERDVHALADQLYGVLHHRPGVGLGGTGQKADAEGAVPAEGHLDGGAVAMFGQEVLAPEDEFRGYDL